MRGLGLFLDAANTVLYRGVETISVGFHTHAAVSRIPALFGFCHGLPRTPRLFKSWTCGFSAIDRFIATPLIGEEFDRLFMLREFHLFFHQSSSHSCFFRAQGSFQIPFLARCQSSGGYHTTNQR